MNTSLRALLAAGALIATGAMARETALPATANERATDRTEATRAFARTFLDRYFMRHDFGAYAALAAPDFIQHDPDMADGVAGHRAFFAKLMQKPRADPPPPPPRHVTDMVLVDGDIFAMMHHSVTADGKARLFVDLWRVADGRIAEHWDVIQPIPATSLNGNGMGCGNYETWDRAGQAQDSIAAPTCGLPDPEADRAASLQVYHDYVAQVARGDVIGAINHYLSADYRQHSPIIADGRQGAIDYLRREWGDLSGPKPQLGPQRIVAEGDLVLVHYILTDMATGRKSAQVDIFRMRNGQIAEHWDIKQPVPDHAENGNGMW